MELSMIQKERDLLRHTQEEDAASLRKRYQVSIDEQKQEIEEYRRIKSKLVSFYHLIHVTPLLLCLSDDFDATFNISLSHT